MIGLMKKDFYNVASSLKIYLLIPLLFAFLGYQDGSTDLLAFGTCFLGIFVVISCFAYDDMAHFNDYALTLPIDRKDLVLSKFLMGNIFLVIVLLISNLFANGVALLAPNKFVHFDPLDFLQYTFIASVIVNIVSSFILIIMFKYGSEKGRIVFLVTFLGIGLVGGLLGKLFGNLDFSNLITFLDEYLPYIILPISIIVEAVAIVISNQIMKKKEL